MSEVRDERQAVQALTEALDRRLASGRTVGFWLRDDDASRPGPQLDRLLDITRQWQIPLTLAVIPAHAGDALARQLQALAWVTIAVHGWNHDNHAPEEEKKQELGDHRDPQIVLAQLKQGLVHLQQLHGEQCKPLLVPPWNRLSSTLPAALPALGFRAISGFAEQQFEALPTINTHVDIIDWRGHRGGRQAMQLLSETAALIDAEQSLIGVLTHHQVHDNVAWAFLQQLFSLTATHPAARWQGLGELMSQIAGPDPGFPGQQQSTVGGL